MIRCSSQVMSVLITLSWAVSVQPARAQTITYLQQIGSAEAMERASAVAADAAGIYAASNPLGGDPFLRKFDSGGNEMWNRRLGGPGEIAGVAVSDTGVYVVGSTDTVLPGQTGAGDRDAFVRKYDIGGHELWTRQFGTPRIDTLRAVAVDATGVYVAGEMGSSGDPNNDTSDTFLRKYSLGGDELWTQPFGSPSFAIAVAVDGSGVYLAGDSRSGFSVGEGFVRKYDTTGSELWTSWYGAGSFADSVAADSTGVYLAGSVIDAGTFVRKYDSSGNQLWTRLFGASGQDFLYGPARIYYPMVAVDGEGVFVAGSVKGVLPGQCTTGQDAFVKKFDVNGNEQWTRQFGAPNGAAVDVVLTLDAAGAYVFGDRVYGATSDHWNVFLARLEKAAAFVAVDTRPRILWECVVNAASYQGGGVAPGEIVTILGSGIGPVAPAQFHLTEDGRLASTLSDTRVLFDGLAAPLLYVSEGQTTAIVPHGVAGNPAVNVQVEYQGVRSDAVVAAVLDSRVGIFSVDASGRGQAAAWNEDGTPNSRSNPARWGSVVRFRATGEGLSDPPGQDGLILGSAPPNAKLPVELIVSDEDGNFLRPEVLHAGGVSGSAGLLQIDVRLPDDLGFKDQRSWRVSMSLGPANGWSLGSVTIDIR